jgi:hypothetical protein
MSSQGPFIIYTWDWYRREAKNTVNFSYLPNLNIGQNNISGVTTMGSDRENPGANNPNGLNGGPQAQAIQQKHWPGPLICYDVVF